jgi:hypothetical protein
MYAPTCIFWDDLIPFSLKGTFDDFNEVVIQFGAWLTLSISPFWST